MGGPAKGTRGCLGSQVGGEYPSGPKGSYQVLQVATKYHGELAGAKTRLGVQGAQAQPDLKTPAYQAECQALGRGSWGGGGHYPVSISSPGLRPPRRPPVLTRACSWPAWLFPSLI